MRELSVSGMTYRKKWISSAEYGLLFLIGTALVLKFRLLFFLNIDVDEFTFLSAVHDYLNGRLATPFFSFHVHLFSWLPLVSTNEVSQIIAGRGMMYVLSLGSTILTFLIARLFLNKSASLFSVLCYLSISNMMVHGTSFRFDPMSAFLFLTSIYFLLKTTDRKIGFIVSGFSIALSLMITLKTLFHILTIATIFIMQIIRTDRKSDVVKNAGLFIGATVIGYILLYNSHVSTLPVGKLPGTTEFVNSLASEDILFRHTFPNWPYTMMILLENLSIWALWFAGVILVLPGFLSGSDQGKDRSSVLMSFLVCFAPLVFYKFVHPYFFVFILSPAVVFCGVMIDRVVERFNENGSKLLFCFIPFMAIVVFYNFIVHYGKNSFDQMVSQREIVRAVHEIFPDPVPYIDRCSMISSFPQVGFQMTTWDMERYAKSNTPIMKRILFDRQPVFILANSVYLDLDSSGEGKDIFKNYPLLEEDYKTLRDNFIRHWGVIYVAGKRLNFDTRETSRTFEIFIPGTYTIEADVSVIIDGVFFTPGSKIELARKRYTAVIGTVPSKLTLRWGADLFVPETPPSSQPIFFGYYW